MWISRLVDRLGIWAVVEVGPCPWCDASDRHRHLIIDDMTVDKERDDVPAFAGA